MDEAFEANGLRKQYGEITALDGLDLTIPNGELVGFLGPNGAGKTTTMRAMLRLISIDSGTLRWNGAPVTEAERRRIGYMPQERGLYARMKVHEQISYFGRLAGLEADVASREADKWIERVGLSDRRDDFLQTLSVGNQQRVQLAVALVHSPDLLILDEPFAGLDPVAASTLVSIITEQVATGVSAVFSSHQLDVVQDICEHVTIVASGRTVATGEVSHLRTSSPTRLLDIGWADPTLQGQDLGVGVVLIDDPGRLQVSVDATVEPSALISAAASRAEIASVSFEPPSLDQVFMELVR